MNYNHGKIVGTPDAIYYNYPHAHHWSRKWGTKLFNRKQRGFCFYHLIQPPSNQCWGIWQGFWQHDSNQHCVGGKKFLFLLNQTKCTLKKIICCIYLCLLAYLCNTVALILLSRCSKQSQAYLLNLSTQHILNHRTQTHVVMQLQYIKLTNLKNFVQHGCLVFIK